MELVEGETLKGPLPVEVALDYANQIAAALESAHEKGIVHRDLKPANIMVGPGGVVKVLDFGLARMAEKAEASGDPANSPTLTISATRSGVILGTAAYMSPEQARGKTVDKRADIWAFGCLVYEMLTGNPAFSGETTSDILAAVIKEEPDLSMPGVPDHVRAVLARCLRKDPQTRWRDIGDVRIALNEPPANSRPVVSDTSPRPHRFSRVAWPLLAIVSIAAAVLAFLLWRATRPAPPQPLVSFSVDLGPDATPGRDTTLALSPDGARLVFPIKQPGGTLLAVRFLSQSASRPLPGTENALNPFFSPDGEWVGFFSGNKLKKVSIRSGDVVTLGSTGDSTANNATSGRGGAWSANGYILIAPGTGAGLSRVPVEGGELQPVTSLGKGEDTHRWPQLLPGDDEALFNGEQQPHELRARDSGDSIAENRQAQSDFARRFLWTLRSERLYRFHSR